MLVLSSTGWRDAVTPVTIDTSPDRALLHMFALVASLTSARTSRDSMLYHDVLCQCVTCYAPLWYAMSAHVFMQQCIISMG
eukprot:2651383-Pyramimonas_sp.AAC.1